MSDNFIINEQSNIKNDNCNYNANNISNNKIFDYAFRNGFVDKNNSSTSYINTVGVMNNSNYGINRNNINNSTILRNGNMEVIQQSKKELDTRLFPGTPLLSSGQSVLKNTDLSSRLKFGEDTRTCKSSNALSSYSANNFIPLVPCLAENVQNIEHIIPTYWVRGGMSSRSVVRNIDYMKSCGLKK
jgi:hypothetical protein